MKIILARTFAIRYIIAMSPLQQAMLKVVPATPAGLGAAIGVSRQRVEYWLKTGKPSPTYCAMISRITGVSKKRLRPDVF